VRFRIVKKQRGRGVCNPGFAVDRWQGIHGKPVKPASGKRDREETSKKQANFAHFSLHHSGLHL
jgi:hypothetical protein